MADEKKGYTLGALIKSAADELRAARSTTAENAVMQFEKCELELAVTVSGEASAGIRFWLIDAGTKVKGESISKVKLSFGPVAGGSNVYAAAVEGSRGVPFKKKK